jgi:NAD(P)-dependent dehydrogenase (short-subunit alcohol dehydrogenase family)
MHPLRDKVVLVTGASSGIGRAAALRMAGHGARIAVAARRAEALAETAREAERSGASALALPTDVADPEQCRRAVEATAGRFGRLDVLLCCAGVSMRSRLSGSDLSAIEHVMRINFSGILHCTYYAIPHVKQSHGSLVAVSSLAGKRGLPTYAAYCASKFAVQGLYESLRLELAPDRVHVGLFSPGHVDTPLRQNVLGPDGRVWPAPPDPPFRIWPVEKCVDRIVRLIVKRRAESLLPGFVRPMLAIDNTVGPWLGDWILAKVFARAPLPPMPPSPLLRGSGVGGEGAASGGRQNPSPPTPLA